MATLPRPRRQTVATRDVCATLQMVTLIVQQAAWELPWGRTEIAHGIIHPSLFTRRREKIETISYPLLGTSIPVNNFCFLSLPLFYLSVYIKHVSFYFAYNNDKKQAFCNITERTVFVNRFSM